MAHVPPKVEYVHPQVNGVVEGIEEPRCVRYLRVREHLEEWECVVMISANRCASVSVCVVASVSVYFWVTLKMCKRESGAMPARAYGWACETGGLVM